MGSWVIDLHFEEITAEIEARIPAAIEKGLEFFHTIVTPLVPVETGNLAGSGSVSVQGDVGELLYPGPYARNQHYSLNFRHTHGQALYLEQPLVQNVVPVVQVVADELGGALE